MTGREAAAHAMSACPPFEILVELWASEVDDSSAAALDEHVFGCDSCAALMEGLAAVIGALREKTETNAPSGP